MSPETLRALARHCRYLLPLLVLVLLIVFWDWNWFRPLVERQASQALGRPVSLARFDVKPGWFTTLHLNGLTVSNPDTVPADKPPLAYVEHLALQFGLRELFDRRLLILHLDVDQPTATLLADSSGQRNWQLTLPERKAKSDAKPWQLQIDTLNIRDGKFSIVDPALKVDVAGTVSTLASTTAEPQLRVDARGRYDGKPVKARFTGGSVLRLRDASDPYPVDFVADSERTQVRLKGTLLDPLHFGGARLRLHLEGPNLSTLGRFARLPLPNTPPYRLDGRLDYRAGSVLFQDFAGLMGESDLAGDVSVRLQQPRPRMEGKVHSKQVRLADLSGLIGGDPNSTPATAPGGDGRLLPDTPINLPRLQQADVALDYRADSIQGEKLPFDRLAFKLTLDDGVLRASPADFGIGEGALRFYATLDPRGQQLALDGRAELRRVDISRLLARTSYKGSGRIGGFAALKSKGRSAAELMGQGDGELKLAMAGGDFSALLLDLSGLDFGNALLSAIGIGSRTEVRCLVGDFQLVQGKLDTRSFILDTGNTNLLLDGGANMQDETLALRIRTQPKRANIGRLKAPIHIGGTFANPRIRPDFVDIGARTAAAVALGTLLTPLAALLPTLQLSPGEDRDCQSLLAAAEIVAPTQPQPKPKPAK